MPRWSQSDLDAYERRKALPHTKVSDPKPCQRPAPLEANREGEAQGSGCPHVRFLLCRVRLLDIDAKYHSVKDLLDGLSIAGVIRGDQEGQITLEVNQTKVAHYKDEQTLIEIYGP
jgi:hypothetical protein